jgi:hypothetical protein
MKNPKLISSQSLKKSLKDNQFLQPRRTLILLLGLVWVAAYYTKSAIGRPPGAQPRSQDHIHLPLVHTETPLEEELLQKELVHARETRMASLALFQDWKKRYGYKIVPSLQQIAARSSLLDGDRYTALLALAYLGGTSTIPILLPFLKDPVWIIRGGALRALAQVGNSETGEYTLPLLHDPDSTVRLEAIETAKTLQPTHARKELQKLANEPMNQFSRQQKDSIKEKALQALELFGGPQH